MHSYLRKWVLGRQNWENYYWIYLLQGCSPSSEGAASPLVSRLRVWEVLSRSQPTDHTFSLDWQSWPFDHSFLNVFDLCELSSILVSFPSNSPVSTTFRVPVTNASSLYGPHVLAALRLSLLTVITLPTLIQPSSLCAFGILVSPLLSGNPFPTTIPGPWESVFTEILTYSAAPLGSSVELGSLANFPGLSSMSTLTRPLL